MPKTAPGAPRIAGRVTQDAKPAVKARRAARAWRWTGVAVFLLVIVVLFDAYLHLSKTYAENSDEANILLMANDMMHGNVFLTGWSVSDVPFITTELPQMTLLVWMFGLHLNTAHIAAAVTYTLIVAVAMLLAKGKARGWAAVARMALALGILLAPQPGVGVFVVIFSVGHIGTALPVMLTWLVLDRLGRKWYVPLLVALLLGWALAADPLVLVVAILPLLAVCLSRVVSALVASARTGGAAGLRAAVPDRLFEVWLAAAAGAGYLIAWGAGQFVHSHGGYQQQPVPYDLHWSAWFMHSRVVVHGLLQMFGAYFVPGPAINFLKPDIWLSPNGLPGLNQPSNLSGLDQAIAITHVVGVVLAVWGACAIARRFFLRDADFVSQLLLAGIVANIAAYVPSTLADATALNVREIAPVLPFAAVLAGRMLGDRLLTGPIATIRLPRTRLERWLRRMGRLGWLRVRQLGRLVWLRVKHPGHLGRPGRPGPSGRLRWPMRGARPGRPVGELAVEKLAFANSTPAPPRRRHWQWRLRLRRHADSLANGTPEPSGPRRRIWGIPMPRRRRLPGEPGRSLRVRLVAIPFVVLFGWYSFGLFRQADTPAAPEPFSQVVSYLEARNLTYGLGGYWEASVITVETGGAVTIRAVTPACIQPYPWESKSDWYNARLHRADFLLLDNQPGYFSQYSAAGPALRMLNYWARPVFVSVKVPPAYRALTANGKGRWPVDFNFGGNFFKPVQQSPNGPFVMAEFTWFSAQFYPFNLLNYLPTLAQKLNDPPAVVCGYPGYG